MQVKETRSKMVTLLTATQKEEAKALIKKKQKEGEKLVKGVFEFVDAQGGWFDFSYRFYPGESIRTVKITHGEIVDIPLDLARHLNNVYKKIRVMRDNADNGQDVVTKVSRTRFIPMDMVI